MTALQLMLPANRAFNSDGAPEAGAQAFLYLSGTSTPALFYSDIGLTVSIGSFITANAAGRFTPMPYGNSTIPYRLVIQDSNGTVLDDVDPFYFGTVDGGVNDYGLRPALALSSGAGLIGWISSRVAAVARTIADKFSDTLSVKDFGAKGDGVTNDTAALQAAINAASLIGTTLLFPSGIYSHTGLIFKNNVRYLGSGKDATGVLGTVLLYSGTGDGVQVNNPINTTTSANILCENICFKNVTRTAGKGAFADTGSTYLKFRNCAFIGADRQLIFDQSELSDAIDCEFDATATGAIAGVWIVNGADRNVGASSGFTNRISIQRCQINGAATAYGILDDGGNVHAFIDNNYNGCLNHIRAVGLIGLRIEGGEFESAAGPCIKFDATTLAGAGVGACASVYLGGGALLIPTAGQNCVIVFNLGNIVIDGVYFGNTTAVKFNGTGNMNAIYSINAFNGGGGATFDGKATNHFEVGYDGTTFATRTNLPLQSTSSVQIGGGTALTKAAVFTPTLTPASVAAATVAEQTFTVTGLTTADKVIVNPPAIANATGIVGARVSAADTLAIRFVNPTAGALVPTSGVYTILAIRS